MAVQITKSVHILMASLQLSVWCWMYYSLHTMTDQDQKQNRVTIHDFRRTAFIKYCCTIIWHHVLTQKKSAIRSYSNLVLQTCPKEVCKIILKSRTANLIKTSATHDETRFLLLLWLTKEALLRRSIMLMSYVQSFCAWNLFLALHRILKEAGK